MPSYDTIQDTESVPAPDLSRLSVSELEQRAQGDALDSDARYALGRKYHAQGQYDRAIEVLGHGDYPELRAWIGIAYVRSGNRQDAMKALQEILSKPDGQEHPALVGMFYAVLGDRDRAFEWLEKGALQRSEDALSACVDPLVVSQLSSDSRYAALVRRFGLLEN